MNSALLNCIRERLKQHRDNLALWKADILRPTVEDDVEQLAVMHDLCVAIAELETVLMRHVTSAPHPVPNPEICAACGHHENEHRATGLNCPEEIARPGEITRWLGTRFALNKCSETERQTALLWAAEAVVHGVLEHPLREEWTATGTTIEIEMKHFERLAVAVAALSP